MAHRSVPSCSCFSMTRSTQHSSSFCTRYEELPPTVVYLHSSSISRMDAESCVDIGQRHDIKNGLVKYLPILVSVSILVDIPHSQRDLTTLGIPDGLQICRLAFRIRDQEATRTATRSLQHRFGPLSLTIPSRKVQVSRQKAMGGKEHQPC